MKEFTVEFGEYRRWNIGMVVGEVCLSVEGVRWWSKTWVMPYRDLKGMGVWTGGSWGGYRAMDEPQRPPQCRGLTHCDRFTTGSICSSISSGYFNAGVSGYGAWYSRDGHADIYELQAGQYWNLEHTFYRLPSPFHLVNMSMTVSNWRFDIPLVIHIFTTLPSSCSNLRETDTFLRWFTFYLRPRSSRYGYPD